jgi:NADH-quinone oxidoreductase subunit J
MIAFAILATCTLLAAIATVRAQNLVHAVLWLGLTLVATAALYALLDASFLAAVQVFTYVGGVVTLMIFGVLLTRRHDGLAVHAERRSRGRGALVAAALFGVLAAAVARTDLPAGGRPAGTADVAAGLLTTHLLAFEALSLLLVAAIVGALVIARKRDPGAPAPPPPRPRGRPLEPAVAPEEQP